MPDSLFAYTCQLNICGQSCLVVGGGPVGQRKAAGLLAAGAQVTVLAPVLTAQLLAWQQAGKISWLPRTFASGDTQPYFLVVAATSAYKVNEAIANEARVNRCLVNVAGQPDLGNFSVPGSYRQNPLTFTVSTQGQPALTKALLAELAVFYPADFAAFAAFLAAQRNLVKSLLSTPQARQTFWQQLLTPELLALVHGGQAAEAKERVLHAIAGLRS